MIFPGPLALASAALMGIAVADWDGTMRTEDVSRIPIFCGGDAIIIGGLPSDSEYEELCTSANTFPCDDKMVVLEDEGPGSLNYAWQKGEDIDCTIAGPKDFNDCKGAYTNCLAKAGGIAAPNARGVLCYVRNGDDQVVATIGINAGCFPIPGAPPKGKRTPLEIDV